MTNTDISCMQRCITLALLGAGYVAPNPMVGAVLVFEGRIIGEGCHARYGEAHAEVNCINSVAEADKPLISRATLYVSLEPCAHFGKTPPCADLIVKNHIPRVVIGSTDPFAQVNGKGIEKLKEAGIEVISGVLEDECKELNKRFFSYHTKQRPYILLKWAQSGNGKIGSGTGERIHISNQYTNRLVHTWRSEEAGILVGTETALLDNPALSNRSGKGPQPVRMVLDRSLRLPSHLQLFNQSQKTIVFNGLTEKAEGNISYQLISSEKDIVEQILAKAYVLQIQSILVEGGALLLQSFIDAGKWDEARVITNPAVQIEKGIDAPVLREAQLIRTENIHTDTIQYYSHTLNS